MPQNRYAVEVRKYSDMGHGPSLSVNTVAQIAELAVGEAGKVKAGDMTWLEVHDHVNSHILEVYYDPPPVNQFLLRHVTHPDMGASDRIEDYIACMNDLVRFTQERFGQWEGLYWKPHYDAERTEMACNELWEYVEAKHRRTLREWKALIDTRDRASEKLLTKMGIRLCQRTEGVRHYVVETADEDPTEEEYTLARVLAADTPDKLARAMLKYIPTIRPSEVG